MKIPKHADIATACNVSLDTVRKWSRGQHAAPSWAFALIARAWPDLDMRALVERWGGRHLALHPR